MTFSQSLLWIQYAVCICVQKLNVLFCLLHLTHLVRVYFTYCDNSTNEQMRKTNDFSRMPVAFKSNACILTLAAMMIRVSSFSKVFFLHIYMKMPKNKPFNDISWYKCTLDRYIRLISFVCLFSNIFLILIMLLKLKYSNYLKWSWFRSLNMYWMFDLKRMYTTISGMLFREHCAKKSVFDFFMLMFYGINRTLHRAKSIKKGAWA